VRVTVDHARGVEVVLPRRAPQREAAAAIRELRPWIERRVAELDRARAAIAARGDAVPYLGELLTLVVEPGRTRVHRRGSELLVPAGDDQRLALERFYRRATASVLATPA
jgi:predicted metal-dependent hydrolase